ncbi:zinc ABC transporter substrate-binding protein [Microbacterium sp. Marseille-Q6648]|uniref:metal ABC transporter solute-binding protein, Zn/Mn family n=1 Tax=Microbacterium sp. Marseille-Q6648 TaxID=2937991 RepID=UPI00203B466A|nr:zinc ABC transporter substrate-binding protein [Microbacterium sp. Marseille-Q6648]
MPALHRASTILGLTAASSLALAGCASGPGPASGEAADGAIAVVASTNVYGQLAEEVGGDLVEVTSIVDSASQDPHSFEPSARDQLTVADAQLVIENGGGYDAFIDALLESSGSEAHVITAVEFSHSWPENAGHEDEHAEDEHAEDEHAEDEHAEDEHAEDEHAEDEHADHGHVEGFNEHVWYDPHTMAYVVEEIAAELAELSPDDAETFSANADALLAEIEGLESELAQLESSFGGAQVFVTEPVSVYLAAAAGLDIVTPDAFSEAVEEGQDVPPATLLEALTLLRDGEVDVVIANAQTGGAETTQVLDEAETASIPVVEFTETLPEGQTYISWMQENIAALGEALEA